MCSTLSPFIHIPGAVFVIFIPILREIILIFTSHIRIIFRILEFFFSLIRI